MPTTTPEQRPLRELFLVEGKSAASTIRQAMNRQTQDVFALQGKVLNVRNATRAKVVANGVCSSLFAQLGCGIESSCDPSQLLYSRVVLLTDPDIDGAHARALLADLFAAYLAPLIQSKRVFAVVPPLWRVCLKDHKHPHYAWTREELDRLRGDVRQAKTTEVNVVSPREPSVNTTRFRGVAQFTREECVRLMLDPATRRQVLLGLDKP